MQFGGNAETSIGAGGFFGAVRLLLRVLCDAVNPSDDLFYRWFASSSASASSPPKLPAFVQNPCSGCVSVCVYVFIDLLMRMQQHSERARTGKGREPSHTTQIPCSGGYPLLADQQQLFFAVAVAILLYWFFPLCPGLHCYAT